MSPSRRPRIDRRRLIASSVVGGAAILTAGQIVDADQGANEPALLLAQDISADVPMFRGNAARTGVMPGPGPDDANGVEAIWTFATGGGIWSSPAVGDGMVFFGSFDGNLYAVDTANGTERWRIPTGDEITSSPAMVDGVVYVGSRDTNLYAVNAEGGSERWRFATGGGISSSPAVVDGVVYIASYDGNIYAVNAEDGTERWRFAGDGPILASPAVADRTVCVLGVRNDDLRNMGNTLYAVDVESGLERWRLEDDSAPILEGGHYVSPSVADGVIYLGNGVGEIVYAINAEDGSERWRFATGGRTFSSPAVTDGLVFFGSEDHNLYAMDAEDGSERWRFAVGNAIYSSPAVVDGIVYFCSISGNIREGVEYSINVFAVKAIDGTEQWRYSESCPSGSFSSSPSIAGNVIYLGVGIGTSGSLYAIGARVPRLGVGGTARVTEETSLRGGPAATAVERADLEPGTMVTITGESVTTGDVAWWPVTVDETGAQGWVEASRLEPLSSGPEPTVTP